MADSVPMVIAHRTCPRDAPENSMAGIAAAAGLGADLVEVDVRRTRDGIPVLLHDPLLLRTTGWPLPIRFIRSSKAQRIRLRRSDDAFVPTLADALASLPEGLRVAIDVKDAGAMNAVIRVVREMDRLPRVALWSQHERAVVAAVRDTEGVEVALLRDTTPGAATDAYIAEANLLGATAVSLHERVLAPSVISDAHSHGLRVYCWVQTRAQTLMAAQMQLDGIVTDWPADARSAIDR